MVDEGKLSEVLCELRADDDHRSPMQGIADRLVKCIVEVLPGTSAGITLIVPETRPAYIAASDELALRYEHIQARSRMDRFTGPRAGEAVSVADLHDDGRFSDGSPRRPGVRAGGGVHVSAAPRHRSTRCDESVSRHRGALDPHDLTVAQTLADVTAAYLVMAAPATTHARLPRASADRPARPAHRVAEPPVAGGPDRECSAARPLERDVRGDPVRRPRSVQAGQRRLRARGGRRVVGCHCSPPVDVDPAERHPGASPATSSCSSARTSTAPTTSTSSRIASPTPSRDPFESGGYEIMITASVGVAYAGPGKTNLDPPGRRGRQGHVRGKAARNGVDSHFDPARTAPSLSERDVARCAVR